MPSLIPLSRTGETLFRQIYLALRQAILAGTFRAGQRLPSTRALADELRVSRTVVLLAYEQLLAEGFVCGRGGSGTFVSANVAHNAPARREASANVRLTRFGDAALKASSLVQLSAKHSPVLHYDFAYGRSDVEVFPFEMWRRILLRHARSAPVREFDYGPAGGSLGLREAIAVHLRRSRAVVCDASQVIVVNGSQQALDLIVRVLVECGDSVAIEDPHYLGAREVLRGAGARLRAVPVDRDGLDPESLPRNARLALVTPSHQFPTGSILSLSRRMALLEWAGRNNAVIVEDDYDGEFRYDDQPLESLQGLDTEGRVIYIGTFSRTIYPALRIGYLVAPKGLVSALLAAKWLCDRHTATLEQETLAEFIASGVYERHLRRVRRRNTARRKALLKAIQHYMPQVEITGDGAGAHLVIWPSHRMSEETLIGRAASHSVGVYGIARYFLSQPTRPGLLLGYTRLNEQQIREGIRRLAAVLC